MTFFFFFVSHLLVDHLRAKDTESVRTSMDATMRHRGETYIDGLGSV